MLAFSSYSCACVAYFSQGKLLYIRLMHNLTIQPQLVAQLMFICLCIYFCAFVEAHLCLYFITSLFHYKYRYIDMPVCGCAAAFFMRVQAHNNLLYVCKIFLFIPIYMPMNVLKRMHRFASPQRNL